MRRPLIAGNWKMNLNRASAVALAEGVAKAAQDCDDVDLAVCAGKRKAFIYRNGRKISTVPESRIIPSLLKELRNL